MIGFRRWNLSNQDAIDLLEDDLWKWLALVLPINMAEYLDLLPPSITEAFSSSNNYANNTTWEACILKQFTLLLFIWIPIGTSVGSTLENTKLETMLAQQYSLADIWLHWISDNTYNIGILWTNTLEDCRKDTGGDADLEFRESK